MVSKGLRFDETSIKNITEERHKNKNIIKELNWNNYERIRTVGKGAFGTAVLYRKKPDGHLVILKEINMNDLTASERQLSINEVNVLSIINHPNIISYYDSYEYNGALYIEMEYANAGTLAELISQLSTPLEEYEILKIFHQIVSAISYLHDNHILHRDIKTANIFMNKEGYIKVGDFGISKMLNSRKEANTVVGTPYYISPEICEGKNYNQKSDIWSLGCVLYEIACLQKTFEGTNLPALINKIVKGQFAPVKRNYSIDFRNLIKTLLQKNPDLRPTADEVMTEVIRLENNLINRYRLLTQHHQELQTQINDISTCGAIGTSEQNGSLRCPRSIVYEVKLNQPHVSLEKVSLPKKKRIKELSKSSTHFLALTYDYAVYSWGSNDNGQLGHDESGNEYVSQPKLVESLRDRNIIRVCAGEGFSVFVSKNGLVLTCGACLGRSNQSSSHIPKLVDSLLYVDVSTVCCGVNHVAIVTGDGKAYTWGNNTDGKLGIGNDENVYIDTPTLVEIPDGVVIKNVFCGCDATAYIDDNGSVWMCGKNDNNKLGLNEKHQFRVIKISQKSIPTKLKWLKDRVVSVSLGESHAVFLIEGGKMVSTGANNNGQLGLGHVRNVFKPQIVKQLEEHSIIKVQTASQFTIALNYGNILYFWGTRVVPNERNLAISTVSSRSYRLSGNSSGEETFIDTAVESANENANQSLEAIKIGKSNDTLMKIVEIIGPDCPILQIRDPKVIIDNIGDLSILKQTNPGQRCDVILKPQAIVSLYASSVHLNKGEMISLSNIYCFDDCIYIIIDTTIPSASLSDNKDFENVNHQRNLNIIENTSIGNMSTMVTPDQSVVSENIPDWIKREIEDDSNCFNTLPLKKADSLPAVFADRELTNDINRDSNDSNDSKENERLKTELENVKKENRDLRYEIQQLKEQITRMRRRELQLNKNLCSKCVIQ